MLDQKTKQHINNARNVLVGKVPDPKAQVEQITTALIYKFMDDMDKENEELGGKIQFFTENLKGFSWSKLMSRELSGDERWNIYTRALEAFAKAEQIPELFRTIFKGAFLPYRDPQTLNLFLKEINEFKYDHSENLGNAFEYLLSVLGSQGDAGQFRTPRHIIDFIVEVVNPQKDDMILDPACGTAGFLISSYKHIKKINSSSYDSKTDIPSFVQTENKDITDLEIQSNGKYNGDKLKPADRKKLAKNIVGYDISPDMVRLSLVNMYLHGFVTPKIQEYDTLTYEDKWNDDFDVILANPPFMTPKGGIRPHKRFQVQANRAEVLFVDYIAEHLKINGRAGIIVPEGIIFQSSNAYKSLRKMLVDNNYLYAVVSLPAGVFQPYSGVKTSILFLDKQLSKKNKEILFVKVENDGFDLGAQRRKIDKNDLPKAFNILRNYQHGKKADSKLAVWVTIEKIAENGDYNLTGDRYKETIDYSKVKWPMVKLGDVCENLDGKRIPITKSDRKAGKYPYYGASGIVDYVDDFLFDENLLLISEDGANLIARVTPIAFSVSGKIWVNNHAHVLKFQHFESQKFVEVYINSINIENYVTGMAQPKLNQKFLNSILIPFPPLEIQKEIVTEIDGYQKIIDGARQVVENWKPQIKINPEWPIVKLNKTCKNLDGKRVPITKSDRKPGKFPYYGASGIVDYVEDFLFDENLLLISEDGANLIARVTPIAFSVTGKIWVNNHVHVLRFQNIESQKFVETYINSINIEYYVTGMAQPKLNQKSLNSILIPFPPLEVQKQIVSEIEKEQEMVNSFKKLIEIHEKKRKDRIAEVWGTQ